MRTLAKLLATVALAAPMTAQLPPFETQDLYVSDYNNDRIAVYSGAGAFLRSFTAAGLDGPRGITCLPDGRTFVASQTSSAVYVFDANEQYLTQFGHSELSGPTGIAVSPDGELFVSSFNNARVCVFATDGTFARSITAPGLGFPNCAAFDSTGRLYVASVSGAQVFQFDAAEQFVTTFRPPPPTSLSSPMAIARDVEDTLYVSGGGSNNIVKFATDGTFLGEIAHPDLSGPQGIAFDDRGHMWSSSFYQHKLVEFDASGGYVQTISAGGLSVPRSIAFARGAETGFTPLGCGVNPAGTVTVQSGAPRIGTSVAIGFDNPLDTQTPGATTPWLLGSLRALPTYPCGVAVPGFGMAGGGAAGELLVDLAAPWFVLAASGVAWQGVGQPATVSFAIPGDRNVVGWTIYAQGVLLDLGVGATLPIALTDAVEIRIGG